MMFKISIKYSNITLINGIKRQTMEKYKDPKLYHEVVYNTYT